MSTTLATLDEVLPLARAIVERVIWCTVATVSPDGEPRTRLMHPVWEWDGDAPAAFVTARTTALKRTHLAANRMVSCSYWDPQHDTLVVDALAEWLDPAARRVAWEAIRDVPPPMGFDPAMIWPDGPDADDCGILRFTAHRIVATSAGATGLRWRA